jgi:hypothetical protein
MKAMTKSSLPRSAARISTHPAPEDVTVWNWPLRDEGLRSWAMLIGIAGVVSLIWMAVGSLPLTFLSATTLLLAVWRLWLPVKWELGLTGITQTVLGFRRRIPWLAVARFELRSDGVWLFADREASPLRAVFIGYGGQRTKIAALVDYYLGTWTHSSDSTQSFLQL